MQSLSIFFLGCSHTPNYLSHRIIFLFIFLVPAVLFPAYSAVLTSFLTIDVPKQPFRNLEELSQSKTYKLGVHNTLKIANVLNLVSSLQPRVKLHD